METNGRTDTTDRIILPANAVGKNLNEVTDRLYCVLQGAKTNRVGPTFAQRRKRVFFQIHAMQSTAFSEQRMLIHIMNIPTQLRCRQNNCRIFDRGRHVLTCFTV